MRGPPAHAGLTYRDDSRRGGGDKGRAGWPLLGLQVNAHQLREGFGVELFHDLGTMHLDGALADAEVDRNRLVGDSLCYQLKDFMLAFGQ